MVKVKNFKRYTEPVRGFLRIFKKRRLKRAKAMENREEKTHDLVNQAVQVYQTDKICDQEGVQKESGWIRKPRESVT